MQSNDATSREVARLKEALSRSDKELSAALAQEQAVGSELNSTKQAVRQPGSNSMTHAPEDRSLNSHPTSIVIFRSLPSPKSNLRSSRRIPVFRSAGSIRPMSTRSLLSPPSRSCKQSLLPSA